MEAMERPVQLLKLVSSATQCSIQLPMACSGAPEKAPQTTPIFTTGVVPMSQIRQRHSERMGRSRSRSRDRERRRTRSRSRGERGRSRSRERSGRGKWDSDGSGSDAVAAMQAIAALQQQQQLQRQLLAQQSQQHQISMQQQQQQAMAAAAAAQTLQPNPDLALDAAPTQANKKQRELYIGNLASGVVTTEMLRELFNAVLVNMCTDPINYPPVLDVKADPTGRGRFAFVELRTAALAMASLHLDKMELCGRTLNIGRPKGYVEPPELNQQARLTQAMQFASQVSGGPTNVLLLENMLPAALLRNEQEKQDLHDDVYAEASKCGTVSGVAIPLPPPHLPEHELCRVYVKFTVQENAAKCKAQMDGREFNDRRIKATYASDHDYWKALGDEWV